MRIRIKPWFTPDHAIPKSEIKKAERKPWVLHLQTDEIEKLELFEEKAETIVNLLNAIFGAKAVLIKSGNHKSLINISFEASEEEYKDIENRILKNGFQK